MGLDGAQESSYTASESGALRAEHLRRQLVDAQEARDRADQLHLLTAALSQAITPADVAQAVVDQVQGSFRRVAGVVMARVSRADVLDLMRARDMPQEVFDQWRSIPLSTRAPLTDVVRDSTPIFLESLDDWRRRYPELAALAEETGHQAQMVGPLIVAGRAIGSIGVAFREPRNFLLDERELFMSIAGQCALALDRACLFESERDARKAAETANKAKGDFLTAMSHELRTPLNAIAGHVDLLALNLYGPTTDEQQAALARVKRAEQHLLGIVDELLSFARLERGRVDFHITTVKVEDAIHDVTPIVAPLFAAKNITYSVRLGDGCGQVKADRGKLSQILVNLLTNASKFTMPGGQVTVEARERDRVVGAEMSAIELSVTDTGIGIPADKLEAIFDPFVQLDTDPSSRQQGTGLGLAISRDLARGMGGALEARSTPGVSTTFVLTLRKAG